MIYTYRRYCTKTGWMADDDRSREVKVKHEQKAGIFSIKVQWLNKICCHAMIISVINTMKHLKGGQGNLTTMLGYNIIGFQELSLDYKLTYILHKFSCDLPHIFFFFGGGEAEIKPKGVAVEVTGN